MGWGGMGNYFRCLEVGRWVGVGVPIVYLVYYVLRLESVSCSSYLINLPQSSYADLIR